MDTDVDEITGQPGKQPDKFSQQVIDGVSRVDNHNDFAHIFLPLKHCLGRAVRHLLDNVPI